MSDDDLRKVIADMRAVDEDASTSDEWLSIDYWADRLEAVADDVESRLLPRSPDLHVDELVYESRDELDARSQRVAELMGSSPWVLVDPVTETDPTESSDEQ